MRTARTPFSFSSARAISVLDLPAMASRRSVTTPSRTLAASPETAKSRSSTAET